MDQISEEKLIDCKIIFDLFDKDKDGVITTNELEDTIRAVGLNPIQSELNQIKSEIDKNNDKNIPFNKFLEIYLEFQQSALTESALRDCFKIFEKNPKKPTGKINKEEFKNAMLTLGDKLEETIFDDIMKFAVEENGEIDYEIFIQNLMRKAG